MEELREEIRTTAARLVAEVCLRDHAATQRLGLGGTDARFLSLLDRHGPLTPGRLALLTGLTTGSVTGVIDRLERAGYVHRERDDSDRRKVLVVPAPRASLRFADEHRGQAAVLDGVLDGCDAAELAVIARFLGGLVERTEQE